MAARTPPITLTTDFGTTDPFVGIMKGVILGISPETTIVDITHEIPAQDVSAAAFHLGNAWRHFPRGTVHVAVVDTGVGSSRRALALSAGDHFFVGPDNGLLTPIFNEVSWRAVEITAAHYLDPSPSPTFHGRDVFAPAAAHLAKGTALENFGEPLSNPVRIDLSPPVVEGATIRARIVHVDRFGNLVLNVEGAHLARAASGDSPRALTGEVAGRKIDLFVTHYAAAKGSLCFLVNSDGCLEVALPGGSAAATLGVGRGDEILVRVG